jgi:hypothetical protein
MAEVTIFKTSEKILIWLHREDKTQVWLADQLNQTRQSISNKMKDNSFTAGDLIAMKRIGVLID